MRSILTVTHVSHLLENLWLVLKEEGGNMIRKWSQKVLFLFYTSLCKNELERVNSLCKIYMKVVLRNYGQQLLFKCDSSP